MKDYKNRPGIETDILHTYLTRKNEKRTVPTIRRLLGRSLSSCHSTQARHLKECHIYRATLEENFICMAQIN